MNRIGVFHQDDGRDRALRIIFDLIRHLRASRDDSQPAVRLQRAVNLNLLPADLGRLRNTEGAKQRRGAVVAHDRLVGLGRLVHGQPKRRVQADRRGFVGHVFRDERIADGVLDAGVSSAEVGEQVVVSDLQEKDEAARPDETLDPRLELVLWKVQVGEVPEYLRRDHGRALLEFADERVERLLRGQGVSRDAERLVGCHGLPSVVLTLVASR